jgi:hypothetical protein
MEALPLKASYHFPAAGAQEAAQLSLPVFPGCCTLRLSAASPKGEWLLPVVCLGSSARWLGLLPRFKPWSCLCIAERSLGYGTDLLLPLLPHLSAQHRVWHVVSTQENSHSFIWHLLIGVSWGPRFVLGLENTQKGEGQGNFLCPLKPFLPCLLVGSLIGTLTQAETWLSLVPWDKKLWTWDSTGRDVSPGLLASGLSEGLFSRGVFPHSPPLVTVL